MADTETSKAHKNAKDSKTGKYISVHNYIVIWTISLRAYGYNLVTLYGYNPFEMVSCFDKLHRSMKGNKTLIYFHNLSYDYTFLRQFLFKKFGYPANQLNTQSHNPINIEFKNGITLRDSLILAQRSLERWGTDLQVEHSKAIGSWDYDKIRSQKGEKYSDLELHYAEYDTLCGVECLDKTREMLNKRIYSMPYTATGIVRNEVQELAKLNRGHQTFKRQAPTLEQYEKLLQVYHGGFTHANRAFYEFVIDEKMFGRTSCRDFASSYPYVMLSENYPSEQFYKADVSLKWILKNEKQFAAMFRLRMVNVILKDPFNPMPCLQCSKLTESLNVVADNGRVLQADYVEIICSEQTLKLIDKYYYYQGNVFDVEISLKAPLPRWLTDYIYSLFEQKTYLKGKDAVLYALAKARLNSVYGMTVQQSIKDDIIEDYKTGEYHIEFKNREEAYKKYLNNRKSVLPYYIGVWVTEYAMVNLFQLGECVDYENGGQWIYSDTDSCYSNKWNEEKLEAYNNKCKEKLLANGYGPVIHENKEYWLGVAEFDGEYKQFITCGAKRYACLKPDDKIKITVAGVPKKKGSEALKSLYDFKTGYIFKGEETGKLTHVYEHAEKIYKDSAGNWCADSIDLIPCDYELTSAELEVVDLLLYDSIGVQIYDENDE